MKEIEIETRNFSECDSSYDFGFGKMFYFKKKKQKKQEFLKNWKWLETNELNSKSN